MGNRLGGQAKQKETRPKEDKKRGKDEKKEQLKKKEKKGADEQKKQKKKKRGQHGPELDTDFEESSHVTGGDSESCVFHSAENVSASPYLDACTRSELEHGATWSGMFENYPSSQHPQVLSSKDFRDGFSLEACIPPEIARPEVYDEMSSSGASRLEGRSSSSVKSRRSNNSVKSTSASRSRHATPTSMRSQHGDDASSSSQMSGGGGGGYSTPLLSTPVFGRNDRCHSPTSPSSTLTRVQENDDAMDITPLHPASDIHHPHFYNHRHLQQQQKQQQQQQQQQCTDFRNLPKPTSPHPQRRALSPKMTSSPFKMISSDDSSSSPSTPVPQRRAANLLDLFRSGSKGDKNKKNKTGEREADSGSSEQAAGDKNDSPAGDSETKLKSKPLWKTWERSSSKKSEKPSKTASIFGTTRKTEKKSSNKISLSGDGKDEEKKEKSAFEKMSGKINEALSKLEGSDSRANRGKPSQSSSTSSSSQMAVQKDKLSGRTSNKSSDSNVDWSSRAFSGDENKRNSSPPVAKSAAFCIMKLEELERSIEKTIREKFPDAEPFLLRKRSKEELRGSRSLPTTPSLKKKLYVARDVDDVQRGSGTEVAQVNLNGVKARLSDSKDTAQLYEETLPSPAMSPVVLRRFGARTRHASISPKIQRAKTAALYNSPSEMSRAQKAKKTITKAPSTNTYPLTPSLCSKEIQPLTPAQKSESKYDNVSDDTEQPFQGKFSASPTAQHGAHLVRQSCVDEDDSDEVSETVSDSQNRPDSDQRPVIVPTFSAVFGSVSPKLRRHLQAKLEDIDKDKEGSARTPPEQKRKIITGNGAATASTSYSGGSPRSLCNSSERAQVGKVTAVVSLRSTSLDSAHKPTRSPLAGHAQMQRDDRQKIDQNNQIDKGQFGLRSSPAVTRATPGSPGQSAIIERINTLNKSASEGQAVPVTHAEETVLREGSSPHLQSASRTSGKTQPGNLSSVGAVSRDQRGLATPGADSHLSTQPVETAAARNTQLTTDRLGYSGSPGSPRKHSTDHVVFGTAVALPCRLYACSPASSPFTSASPGPEMIGTVNNSHTAHAPVPLAVPSQNVRYARKQKSSVSESDKKPDSVLESTTAGLPTSTSSSVTPATVISCSASLATSADVKATSDTINQSNGATVILDKANTQSALTCGKGDSVQKVEYNTVFTAENVQSSVSAAREIESGRSDAAISAVDETKSLQRLPIEQQQQQLSHHHPERVEQQQRRQQSSPQDEHVVRRQPISQVISHMISEDKEQTQHIQQQQQQQQQQQHQQQQQELEQQHQLQKEKQERSLRQSSPVSPDYGYRSVRPAIAMVTSQSYEQPCLTLEEKTVTSDPSVSLPSSPIGNKRVERDFESPAREEKASGSSYESRSQEIQTDSVTKADKSVDSNGLMDSVRASKSLATVKKAGAVETKGEHEEMEPGGGSKDNITELAKPAELSDSEGSDFLKMVMACKKMSSEKVKAAEGAVKTSEHVPPPSPTAMQQLIQEFREEEEEEEKVGDDVVDGHEKREIEMAMRRETEMQQFTEKIYKRLSDLLGSQSDEEHDLEDDVFEEESPSVKKKGTMQELFSRLQGDRDSFSTDEEDDDLDENGDSGLRFTDSGANMSSRTPLMQSQAKVLTIETSSSLTTTTSSESDVDDAPKPFQNLQPIDDAVSADTEGRPKRKVEPNVFVFPEFNDDRQLNSDDARARRSSREYHSDDDVVAGRGIPDYYDDRPLWSRRQKPPGQLSAAMMAIRRRERRERWLKKRRRNKTDLLSTGSSDTGSDIYPKGPLRLREDSNSFDFEEDDEMHSFDKSTGKNDMGSGILTSPKYTKPILPFFASNREQSPVSYERELVEVKIAAERLQAMPYRERQSESHSDEGGVRHRKHLRDKNRPDRRRADLNEEGVGDEEDECTDEEGEDYDERGGSRRRPERFSSDSNLAIPGIEETFNELMSVQNILEGMQDRTPVNERVESAKCLPLTTENVKSVHEYYKESYSYGNGRRSRMSATDRTESDLDLYSEARDDGSSDSNVYADDEEDDDTNEPYATADDDLGATGGSSSAAGSGRHSGSGRGGGGAEDEDSDGNFVVSCTFYNSNAFPSPGSADAANANIPTSLTVSQGKTSSQPASNSRTPVAVNSDEEFWGSSAAIEESYRQLESAADAVSSTFQNAREQMHDIQHHLQALRRQMEVLQDDLVTTSVTLSPDMSVEPTGKG